MKVTGKGCISAEVIAHSISSDDKEVVTFVLEYPRFIHSEFMTHRMISKNSASSRAIPVNKMIEHIKNSPAMPIHWGVNQPGMQASEEISQIEGVGGVKQWWTDCANMVVGEVHEMSITFGLHKQVLNRLLEPFQMMRVVATATEWDNFFHLRKHKDAQPEIHELANVMWEALQQSAPEQLKSGDWHTPFVSHSREVETEEIVYYIGDIDTDSYQQLTLEQALKVSASCCAQVSYRKTDTSLEKALDIYQRLVDSEPVHASPFEHQATPIVESEGYNRWNEIWEDGVTHADKYGNLWSGNFQGFIQYRQLIPNNVCWDYQGEMNE